ncbi:hypothetical protein [uncultured Methanoregula sp.]|uniref:hypothetical protein n=1 Tax=uncultured Methanoregula sp. TaxID=1005933 RepID=UPI002AAB4CFA|nr:hypothetical protein [uncultured Methanoregula sp.]
MNAKNILTGGLAGGAALLVFLMASSWMISLIIPYQPSAYGGMRAMDDPIMLLFFMYPFVVAFVQAAVFDQVKGSLAGISPITKGLHFTGITFLLMAIPSLFVMYTSMTWPVYFYISTLIWEVVGYTFTGFLFVKIWKM